MYECVFMWKKEMSFIYSDLPLIVTLLFEMTTETKKNIIYTRAHTHTRGKKAVQ